MSEIDMNSVLLQMRAMAAKARGIQASTATQNGSTDFTTLMKTAVDKVNETQQNAAAMAKAFESGSEEVDLSQVMVSLQKANVTFQAATQVRNSLVSAYEDIMNMPI